MHRSMSPSPSPPGGLLPVEGLLLVLLQTFSALVLGYACSRLGVIDKDSRDMKALHLIMGKIALPLLIFKVVATSDLDSVNWGVVLACNLAKCSVYTLTFTISWLFFRSGGAYGQRLLTSTIFGMFTAASNDFAIGLPVVQALYGDKMAGYLAANVFVFQTLIQPATMVLLEVGHIACNPSGQAVDRRRLCRKAFVAIASNIIILATILGVAYQQLLSWSLTCEGNKCLLPHPLADIVDLWTQPFTMTSLFLNGAYLTSSKIGFWPALLVLMKVFFCAYVSYGLSLLFCGADAELNNFAFFYGTLPTGGAPLVLSAQYDIASTGLVAGASMWGLVLAGPIEFMATMFLGTGTHGVQYMDLHKVQAITMTASAVCGSFFAVVVLLAGWRWGYRRWAIACYGLSTFAYTLLSLAVQRLLVDTGSVDKGSLKGQTCIYLLGFFQYLCCLLVIFLEYQRVTRWRRACGTRRLAAVAALLLLALTPSVVRWPNTAHELIDPRSPAPPSRDAIVVLVAWDTLLLLLGLCLTGYGMLPAPPSTSQVGSSVNTNDLLDSQADAMEMPNSPEGASPMLLATSSSRRCRADTDPSSEQPPDTAVTIIVVFQVLRLTVEIVDALAVLYDGGFTPMFILANIMEHGQGCVAFGVLFTNVDFRDDMYRMFSRVQRFAREGLGCAAPDEFPGGMDN